MKCVICKKRKWQLLLTLHAIEADNLSIAVDQKLRICYHCLSFMILSLIRQIDFHKENKKIGTVTPSICFSKRLGQDKFTEEEMIDLLMKISKIKNIEGFREINNEKET